MPQIQYREALRDAMTEEMERDEDVFLLGEEVAEYNGAYKVSEGMLDQFGPRRIIDTPISEAGFSGLAIGAACMGLRPIVEFMSWSFTLVCADQIINNAANVRYMSGGQYKVPVVFRGGNGIAHQLGATHSHRVETLYARIPGLVVLCPATPYEAKGLLKAAIRCDDAVCFLESEIMLNDKGEVPDEEYVLPIGKADVMREGDDCTVISYGKSLARFAQPAIEQLAAEHDISCDLISLRTLRPLDKKTIIESVKKTNRVVIVDEDYGFCGFGAGIMDAIQKDVFDYLDAPIGRVNSDEIPVPYGHYMEEAMLPTADKVIAAVKEACYRD
jgi:pyruvate dehydrogenase E1 component beta subunit